MSKHHWSTKNNVTTTKLYTTWQGAKLSDVRHSLLSLVPKAFPWPSSTPSSKACLFSLLRKPTCLERSHTSMAAFYRFQYIYIYIAHPWQLTTYNHLFHGRNGSSQKHFIPPLPIQPHPVKNDHLFERPRNNVAVLYRFLLLTGSQTDDDLQPLLQLDGSCQRDFVRDQGLPRGTTTSYWGHVCQSGPL